MSIKARVSSNTCIHSLWMRRDGGVQAEQSARRTRAAAYLPVALHPIPFRMTVDRLSPASPSDLGDQARHASAVTGTVHSTPVDPGITSKLLVAAAPLQEITSIADKRLVALVI